jgi:hypothetical protein
MSFFLISMFSVWRRVLPILVQELKVITAVRLHKEKALRKEDRCRSINTMYDNWLKTISPSEWNISPSQKEIHDFPEFKLFIDTDRMDSTFPEEEFEELKDKLRRHVSAYARKRYSSVLTKRKHSLFFITEGDEATVDEEDQQPLEISPIFTLATTAFRSPLGHMYYGLEPFEHVQPRWPPEHISVTFEPRAYTNIALLCEMLGLDTRNTTPDELDKLDPAFVCLACPIMQRRETPHIQGTKYNVLSVWSNKSRVTRPS